MEFAYSLKIPKDRIAVLIGNKGEMKRRLESELGAKLNIDSAEGDIEVTGEDSLNLYTARNIIKAIGRGFNPDTALLLLKPDYQFEIIDITDFGRTKAAEARLKGRVIGREGKSRRVIELLTSTFISVFGKTVCIIGTIEDVAAAKRAIEDLLTGSRHASVYKKLEKRRSALKQQMPAIEYRHAEDADADVLDDDTDVDDSDSMDEAQDGHTKSPAQQKRKHALRVHKNAGPPIAGDSGADDDSDTEDDDTDDLVDDTEVMTEETKGTSTEASSSKKRTYRKYTTPDTKKKQSLTIKKRSGASIPAKGTKAKAVAGQGASAKKATAMRSPKK